MMPAEPAETLDDAIWKFRKQLIQERLDQFKWDFEAVAKSLGVCRKTLWALRSRHGIRDPRDP